MVREDTNQGGEVYPAWGGTTNNKEGKKGIWTEKSNPDK
jgi:hypothetical protein